ncbi:TPA: phage tail protein [Bacillus pseudomycoides]|nr:phage tail protein [Bacillus pseudomycoides]
MISVKIYDKQIRLKAYLENAFKVNYTPTLNDIWSAGFSLPFDDPKRNEIETFDYVEIFDQDKRIGMFRILNNQIERNGEEKTVTYKCEHVLSTLVDGVLFSLHQLTNKTTREVIEYVLSKQKQRHWVLGKCDFTRYFHYNWENESTLLGPLFSIPKPFDEKYQWTWDDSVYPWVLNLVKVSDEITGEIRYRKNLKGIRRHEDPLGIITRVYPLGCGEGVNQLTVKDVNPTGQRYIDAPQSILDKYGVIEYVWSDRRFKDAQSLYDSGKAFVNERCVPKVTYEIDAIDYELIDPYQLEKYRTGKLVRVFDEELGINVDVRVISHSKDDVTGDPLNIKLVLANKRDDIGTIQADIAKRQQINEVYAQGSTNIDSSSFADNCDQDHPARLKFYLPEDLVNINAMVLSFETSKFRAFERATKGGGATTVSSSAGGGTVSSTSSGGGTVGSTSAGGGSVQTSSSGGGVAKSTDSGGSSTVTSLQTGDEGVAIAVEYAKPGPDGDHTHIIPINFVKHTHAVNIPAHSHSFNVPNHTHNITVPNHTHDITVPNHTHDINIPNHTHEVTIPDHVHDLEFGIYELDRTPSSMKIAVDGNELPITATSGENIDIIPYLSKDDSGKINRGRWVEITLTPNDLARIDATVNSRLFISSHIGGTF